MNNHNIILYSTDDGNVNVEVFVEDETIWLNQKQVAQLFGVEVPAISKHIRNIFEDGELFVNSTVSKMEIVQQEGNRSVKRSVDFYNLDMIIAVGYRVNSKKATSFRIWSTNILKEYIVKGFVLDDDRLKLNSKTFGKDYFKQLLERIREIRVSERRLYQQLKDIYSLSKDYDKSNRSAMLFFARVQNKMHYAVTGKTAAEVIDSRVNHKKNNMGLTNYDGERIYKRDVIVAKNYLLEGELAELRLIVNMFLDMAELRAKKRQYMMMSDWEIELDKFIEYNEMKLLIGKGSMSKLQADKKALSEYRLYRQKELEKEKSYYESEFIVDIKELEDFEDSLSFLNE